VINNIKEDFKTAEECFQKALSLKDDYLEAMINLAGLYQNARRWNEAAAQLEKYIEIDNNDYNIHNQLGVVYLEIGESGKVCTVLERSLELNSSQPSVRESLDAVKKSTSA
jgi:tetratricopeptide (TPR) repeat protein